MEETKTMSHIVEIKTEIRDEASVQLACGRLGLPPAERGTFSLFTSTETGLGIRLRDWKYPVVANTDTGQLRYDNFNGRWGRQENLDSFLQKYAVERAKLEARKKGHSVVEQALPNGSIKLTVNVGSTS